MKPTIFAFDFNGTVQAHPMLRELARALLAAGHECHVISGVGNASGEEPVRREVSSWGIPWTSIRFVTGFPPLTVDGEVERDVGRRKVAIMREIGAAILIDDNRFICEEVRKAGLLAVQV